MWLKNQPFLMTFNITVVRAFVGRGGRWYFGPALAKKFKNHWCKATTITKYYYYYYWHSVTLFNIKRKYLVFTRHPALSEYSTMPFYNGSPHKGQNPYESEAKNSWLRRHSPYWVLQAPSNELSLAKYVKNEDTLPRPNHSLISRKGASLSDAVQYHSDHTP